MAKSASTETFYPETRAAWRRWLQQNHQKSTGVWMVYFRKSTGHKSLSYDEAVEEALCFGWIDATMRKLDEERLIQWFCPRRPQGNWSSTNKARAEKLIAAGLMTKAGFTAIEIAKANGSWNRLETIEQMVIPADLQKALSGSKKAFRSFEACSNSIKRQYLWLLESAKRKDTRMARLNRIIAELQEKAAAHNKTGRRIKK